MFTGLIEEVGRLRRTVPMSNGRRLFVECRSILEGMVKGDSVALNGVCQTVVGFSNDGFTVESVGDTLTKTTLGGLVPGDAINLERACRAETRMGGHFVLGHVQGVERILDWSPRGDGWNLEVSLDPRFRRYVVDEGSITVDGISLTVAGVTEQGFRVSVIPHTKASTRLSDLARGARVNLEVDILAKYVEAMVAPTTRGLDLESLAQWGYR